MELQLIGHRRSPADDRWRTPSFDEAVSYAYLDWSCPHLFGTEDPWYVQMLEAGAEVARIELKEDVDRSTVCP